MPCRFYIAFQTFRKRILVRLDVRHFGGDSKMYKKLVTHAESHASEVSLLETGEQRYIKATVIIIITGGPAWPSGKAVGW